MLGHSKCTILSAGTLHTRCPLCLMCSPVQSTEFLMPPQAQRWTPLPPALLWAPAASNLKAQASPSCSYLLTRLSPDPCGSELPEGGPGPLIPRALPQEALCELCSVAVPPQVC